MTTTAPTGTSPRVSAAAASSSATRIQRRSVSPGVLTVARWERTATARSPSSQVFLLGHVLAAALFAFLRGAGGTGRTRGPFLPRLVLALLNIRLFDHHRLGDVLHRATRLQVLVDLLAVDRAREARTCSPERQERDPHHQRDSSHAWASLRLRADRLRQ